MLYHQSTDSLYIFGGTNRKNYFNDLWSFSLKYNLWERVEPTSAFQPSI